MREIVTPPFESIASPARHILQNLHLAISNIAPEKEADFNREFNEFVLEYVDDHKWICEVLVKEKHITLSRKVIEVIWPAALFYFQVYHKQQTLPMGVPFEISSDPVLGPTARLMQWSLETLLGKDPAPWPSDLPAPVPNPAHASDLHVADELTYCAVAFLLHHELAHIRLRHEGESEIDSERDADYLAAAWILDSVVEDDPRFDKRILGIATVFGVFTSFGFYTGYHGGGQHPRSFDRLLNTLDRHVHNPNHQVWWVVVVILSLHASNTGRTIAQPEGGFSSAREAVDAYAELLSREKRRPYI